MRKKAVTIVAIVDPKRLKHDARVSPLLSDALEALCERESDAARMARVSSRLGGLLDAPPSPAGPLAATGRGATLVKLGKVGLSFKVVLSAVLGVFTATWVANDLSLYSTAGSSTSEQPLGGTTDTAGTLPAERASSGKPSAGLTAAPGGANTAEPRAGAAHTPHVRPEPAHERFRTKDDHTFGSPAGRGHLPLRPLRAGPKRGTVETSATATTTSTPDTSAQTEGSPLAGPTLPDVAGARAPGQGKPVGHTAAPPREETRPPDELTLLLGARAALATAPRRAFQLLTQHATSYPQGVLAPEREVLAIDALQRMGRTAEAQQRQALFEQHYPESFHSARHRR